MNTPIGVRVVQFSAGDHFHYGVTWIGDTYRIGALRVNGEFWPNVEKYDENGKSAKIGFLRQYEFTYLYLFLEFKMVSKLYFVRENTGK